MAGPYSAGTIFLQVVPSYKGLQESVGAQGKQAAQAFWSEFDKEGDKRAKKAVEDALAPSGSNDPAGDAGDKAGKSYAGRFRDSVAKGLKDAQRELASAEINIDLNDKAAVAKLAAVRKQIDSLTDGTTGELKVDAAKALATIKLVERQLNQVQADAKDIDVRVDTAAAMTKITALRKQIQGLSDGSFATQLRAKLEGALKSLPAATIQLDDVAATQKLDHIRTRLAALSDQTVGIDIDAGQALSEIALIEADLKVLSESTARIDVKVDAAAAIEQLAAMEALVEAVSHNEVDVKVDVNGAAEAVAKLTAVKGAGDDAERSGNGANAGAAGWRAFNAVILAAVSIGPALIPILAAMAVGLIGVGNAALGAGSGVGVLFLAFSGISKAVQAFGAVQDNQTKDSLAAGKATRSAANSVRTATESLASAKRSAAQSVASAVDSERRAEENLQKTQRDSIQAQKDLVAARIQAAQDIQDLTNSVAENALAERQGVIDLFNATVAFRNTQADPGATNLDKEQSSIDLAKAQLSLKETREESTRLAAQKSKSDQQGVNGSDLVTQAQQKVTDAVQSEKDARIELGRAAKAVDDARIEGANNVRQAQEGLANAQDNYNDALTQTGTVGSASMQQLQDALGKLSPAGRNFAAYIFSLRDGFYAIRAVAQQGILPGVEDAMKRIIGTYGPQLKSFVGTMASVIGVLFVQFGKLFTSPLFQQFFDDFAKFAPIFTQQFAGVIGNLITGFLAISDAFLPFSKGLGDSLVGLSGAFSKWAVGLKGSKAFNDFLAYIAKVGPEVWGLLKNVAITLIHIAEGLAPFGGAILKGLEGIFGFLAGLDPKLIGNIAFAVLGLVLAFQLAAGAVALVANAGQIFMSTTGVWILAIVAIGVGLVLLYRNSKTFRDFVNTAWAAIKIAVKAVVDFLQKDAWPVISKVFKALGDAAVWLWKNALGPAFQAIGAVVIWLWDKVIKPYFELIALEWKILSTAFKIYFEDILWPVIRLVGTVIFDLYKLYFKVVFDLIKLGWKAMAVALKYVYDTYIAPLFKVFSDIVSALHKPFDTVVGKIGEAWDKIQDIVKTPIKFVVNTVLNDGLIAAFNKIASWVEGKNASLIPKIPLPKGFATGGIFPGYTPGKDIGYIGVSGGEAIMRPEWTRAVGPDYVHAMNAAARVGGVSGVKRFLGGFSGGGVTPSDVAGAQAIHSGGDLSFGDIGNFFASHNPVSWIKGRVTDGLHALEKNFGDNPFVNLLEKLPQKLLGSTVKLVESLVGKVGGAIDNITGAVKPPSGRSSDYSIVDAIAGPKFNPFGDWSTGPEWAALSRLVDMESGFNHLAQNPTSTAFGLFQFLDGTWGGLGYSKTSDPVQQTKAGLKYIHERYGDPIKALQFHLAHGWYADGGVVPTLYDSGGFLPPGISVVANRTNAPEPILTSGQWDNLTRTTSGGGFNPTLIVNPQTDRTSEVVDETMFALRGIRRGGKYATSGQAVDQ